MKRGEIRWYQFQRPDKNRPVLILTRDSAIGYLGDVTVVPVTTSIRDIPVEVFLDKTDGMLRDCAINCDHLQTIAKTKIGSLIATLSNQKMDQVRNAIAYALTLE